MTPRSSCRASPRCSATALRSSWRRYRVGADTLTRRLESLPRTIEFILVVGITFGLPLVNAFAHAFGGKFTLIVSNRGIVSLCVYEVLALLLVAYVLRVRGWSLSDLRL